MKKHILPIGLCCLSVLGLQAQGSFRTTAGAYLKASGNAYIKLKDAHWDNSGSFSAGSNSTVEITGSQVTGSQVAGSSPDVFRNLSINRSAGVVSLQKGITVNGNLTFTAGNLDLNGKNLILGQPDGILLSEGESKRVFSSSTGEVLLTTNLIAPNQAKPGNIGVAITSSANLGNTTIRRGHQEYSDACLQGIKRYFSIQPANNIGLNATLRFYYLDAELNGVPESDLILFRSDDNGATWTPIGFDTRNTTENWVEKTGLSSFALFTLATEIPPFVTCKNIQKNLNNIGVVTIDPFDLINTITPCVNFLSYSQNIFSCYDVGVNFVVVDVANISGNFSSCIANVAVQDVTNPTLTCPSAKTVIIPSGQTSAVVDGLDANFSDNCSILQINYSMSGATTYAGSGSINSFNFNPGTTTVSYEVKDPSNNKALCSFTVTVTSCTTSVSLGSEKVVCPSPGNSVLLDAGNPGATYKWSTSATTQTISVTASGLYHVTVTTDGCSAADTVQVKFEDNIPPSVTCPINKTEILPAGAATKNVSGLGITPTDNCSISQINYSMSGVTSAAGTGSISSFNFNLGTTTVSYEVKDPSSNKATCSFTVTVTSCTTSVSLGSDKVVCPSPGNSVLLDAGNPGATYKWSTSATIQTISVTSTGLYHVTVTANGCSAADTIQVKFEDNIPPSVTCPANKTEILPAVATTKNVSGLGITPTDNCSISQINYSMSGATTYAGSGSINSFNFKPGTTTVSYEVKDNSGNSKSCEFTVFLSSISSCSVDLGPDIITCPGDTVILNAGNNPATTQYLWGNGKTTQTIQITSATLFSSAYYVTITDNQGCTATDNVKVSFKDNPPTALCKNDTVFLDASGVSATGVAFINNGSYDDCTDLNFGSYSLSKTAFGCSDIGASIVVILTVKDGAGKKGECNAFVTVLDTISPLVTCKDVNVALKENGQATVTLAEIATISDNCGTPAHNLDINSFGCNQIGKNQVIVTATDQSGNKGICHANVTVSPLVKCPQDTSLAIPPGFTSTQVFNIGPVTNSACLGSISWKLTGSTEDNGLGDVSGHSINAGMTQVTYTPFAPGGSPLPGSCSFNITIQPVVLKKPGVINPGLDCISFDGNVGPPAMISAPFPVCANSWRPDNWYAFKPNNHPLTLKVAGSSSMTPVVEVFRVSGSNVIFVDCAEASFKGGIASLYNLSLTQGQTHYARVYAKESNPGSTWFTFYAFEDKLCNIPLIIPPPADDPYKAEKEFTDTTGWTHYILNDSFLLLSIRKDGKSIGTIDSGNIAVTIKRNLEAYNVTEAPYVPDNQTYIASGSFWKVDAPEYVIEGNDTFGLRVYFTKEEYEKLRNFQNPAIEVDTFSDLCFYKINSFNAQNEPLNPDPSFKHANIKTEDIRFFSNGAANTTQWKLEVYGGGSLAGASEYIGQMDVIVFSGGGIIGKGIADPTGEEISTANNLNVFPIPAERYLTITLHSKSRTDGVFKLFDSFGQNLRIEKTDIRPISQNRFLLDIDKIPSGIYFIVYAEGNIPKATAKFIKIE